MRAYGATGRSNRTASVPHVMSCRGLSDTFRSPYRCPRLDLPTLHGCNIAPQATGFGTQLTTGRQLWQRSRALPSPRLAKPGVLAPPLLPCMAADDGRRLRQLPEGGSDTVSTASDNLTPLDQFRERLHGVEADRPRDFDELGNVDAAAAAFATGNEHLRRAGPAADVRLRQSRLRSQLSKVGRHFSVDEGVVPLRGHARRRSLACQSIRFENNTSFSRLTFLLRLPASDWPVSVVLHPAPPAEPDL